ncbi:type II toxin-antitoxin system ParD family antitoxin [Burkholderia ubonensis]|uniref:type II toxin-antitoxin system ParD family antitoxin n=1 Tax=Burkholderia ubonensis TaxID=101571 RepID=UPI000A3F6F53|nr:type II toxin-antitoxin system ParD family antitoxin [Burkholderia ubonensis]
MLRNSLGDHPPQFVDTQVASGRYGSTSDVVRAGLRLLETQETELKALQEALRAGEASGEPAAFDSRAFLARMRAKSRVVRLTPLAETDLENIWPYT